MAAMALPLGFKHMAKVAIRWKQKVVMVVILLTCLFQKGKRKNLKLLLYLVALRFMKVRTVEMDYRVQLQ